VEAGRIHERLQKPQRMMVAHLPVGADAPGAERQEPRPEVWPASAKEQPHVVGDPVQPPERLAPAPSDPFAAAVVSRLPDSLADLRRRTEIVVRVHERAEARLLIPRHRRHGQPQEIHCCP